MTAPPPSYESNFPTSTPDYAISREEKFRSIINKHEINHDFSQRLQQLQGFKIAFIFDDSGSMNAPLMDSPLNNHNSLMKATRWDEAQYFARIAIEIASLFDTEGCSVYFLNRQPSPVVNVCDESQVLSLFRQKPGGFTPLPRVLNQVLRDNNRFLSEKKLLVVIVSDGEPTDDYGEPTVGGFKQVLQNRSPRVFTSIVACTDDDESMRYLNRWDREISKLDVVDDYRSERNEIKKAKGNSFPFSFGDYVVKSLIGSIDSELDNLDEDHSTCCNVL